MAAEQEEFEFRYRLEQESRRRSPKMMKIGVEGMGDAMRSVLGEQGEASGRLAAFGAIPRELYEGAKQIIGRGDPAAVKATRTLEEEHPVMAGAGGLSLAALAGLVPGAATVAGNAAAGGAMGVLEPTEGNESRSKNALTGLALGGAGGAVMKGVGAGVGKLFQRGTQKAAESAAENTVRDATLKEARDIGLNVPPTVAGGGKVAKALESTGGKAATAQEQSIRNQGVINKVARVEAGLKPGEPITSGSLAKAREVLASPYREIAAISPRAKQALEQLQEARLDAKDAWKKYGGPSGGPAERREAIALDHKVAILERLIDKEAKAVGRADLLPALKQARIAIAKNHDVEAALNIGNGSIDASVIGRLLDRKGEKAVTGGLQTIGKFQQAFPDFARIRPSGQSAPGVGYLKYPLALALGAEGYNFGEQHGIGPYGTAAGLLALAGGPARSIALSKLMQSAPTYAPGMASQIASRATTDPRLRTLIPLSAVGTSLNSGRQGE